MKILWSDDLKAIGRGLQKLYDSAPSGALKFVFWMGILTLLLPITALLVGLIIPIGLIYLVVMLIIGGHNKDT